MDKKFAIQFIVLIIAIFVGLFSIFQPQLFGLPSIIPGGGTLTPNTNNTNAVANSSSLAKVQTLFIDAASTGNPELVKAALITDVADTATSRAQGLSNRQTMGIDEGMIFVFEQENQYNFIMRAMQFSLDFIWVKDTQIVDILENIPPDPAGTTDENLKRYAPKVPVNRVIEVNAGYVQKYKIKVGDRIKFEPAATATSSGGY